MRVPYDVFFWENFNCTSQARGARFEIFPGGKLNVNKKYFSIFSAKRTKGSTRRISITNARSDI